MHERDVELAALEQFRSLGYDLRHGPELGPDAPAAERPSFETVILADRVSRSVSKFNPNLSSAAVHQVVRSVTRPAAHPTLVENNRWFHGLLTDGVEVEYKDRRTGETRGGLARLLDLDNPANNDYLVVSQLTVQGPAGKASAPT